MATPGEIFEEHLHYEIDMLLGTFERLKGGRSQ